VLSLIASIFQIGLSSNTAFAFAGAFLVHISSGISRVELALTVVSGAVFAAIYLVQNPAGGFPGAVLGGTGAFLRMGSLLVLTLVLDLGARTI
jgi:hypothetical protein